MGLIASLVLSISYLLATTTGQAVYHEGLVGQPVNLTPYLEKQSEVDKAVSSLIYPQLIKYDLRGELSPSLALSWHVSDDGLSYEFNLQDNVYWSNGRRVDADDVIFTAQINTEINNVAVQKIDSNGLRFNLKEPFAPFLSLLDFNIVPRESRPGLKPITLAARPIVKLVRSGQRVDELVIANKTDTKSAIKFLNFKFYDRAQDLKTAADLSEIDAFNGDGYVSPLYINFPLVLEARRYGLFFNMKNETLLRAETRKTLALAIDKNIIIDQALDGLGEKIDIPHLDNSNLGLLDVSLTLTTDNTSEHLRAAALVKEMWEKAGAKVNILPLPFWDISTRVIDTKDFQVLLFGQELGRDPDEYTLWHSTKTVYPGLNISQLSNQRVDESLEDGRKATDPAKRQEYYTNFATMLSEEVPVVFLYKPVYNWVVSKKFEKLIKDYATKVSCCDGCVCPDFALPKIYYPQERFNLLPL